MPTPKHQNKLIVAAVALTFAAAVPAAFATKSSQPQPSKESKQLIHQDSDKRKLLEEKRQQISQEAREVMLGTYNAVLALEKHDASKARSHLQEMLGKIDILIAKYPSVKLIPADVSAQIDDLEYNAEEVKDWVDQADDLLDDNQIQDARQILDSLVSEVRVTTVNIPLGIYPAAIKEAVVAIDANKPDDAKMALENVLDMLVSTTEIIALPVLQAESLLTQASELEHKSDLSNQTSRKEIIKLTQAARDKLKLAELLGYGDKNDYSSLYKNIDEINDTIHSEGTAATLKKMKAAVTRFKDKITRAL